MSDPDSELLERLRRIETKVDINFKVLNSILLLLVVVFFEIWYAGNHLWWHIFAVIVFVCGLGFLWSYRRAPD